MQMCMDVNVRYSNVECLLLCFPFRLWGIVVAHLSNFSDIMEHAVARHSITIHLQSHFTRQLKFLRYNLKCVPLLNF